MPSFNHKIMGVMGLLHFETVKQSTFQGSILFFKTIQKCIFSQTPVRRKIQQESTPLDIKWRTISILLKRQWQIWNLCLKDFRKFSLLCSNFVVYVVYHGAPLTFKFFYSLFSHSFLLCHYFSVKSRCVSFYWDRRWTITCGVWRPYAHSQ